MTMKYRNCSIGSNPLRLPLDRGRDKLAPPLLRGGWEGFESVMICEKINNCALAMLRQAQAYFGSNGILTILQGHGKFGKVFKSASLLAV
jgi:hypothetical protein